jgi:hypothetical protein
MKFQYIVHIYYPVTCELISKGKCGAKLQKAKNLWPICTALPTASLASGQLQHKNYISAKMNTHLLRSMKDDVCFKVPDM